MAQMPTMMNMIMQQIEQQKREALGPMYQVQKILSKVFPDLSVITNSKGLLKGTLHSGLPLHTSLAEQPTKG